MTPPRRHLIGRLGGQLLERVLRFAPGVARLEKPLVFVHVPKCGGNSIVDAIRRDFRLRHQWINHERIGTVAAMLDRTTYARGTWLLDQTSLNHFYTVLAYYLQGGESFVSGHVGVSKAILDGFSETHIFLTVLRDPVERWISHYRYNKLNRSGPGELPRRDFEGDLAEELDRYINSPIGRERGRMFTWMLGGGAANEGIGSPAAVALAKENLARFHVVGLIEDTDSITRQLSRYCGRRLRIPRRNVTAIRERKAKVDYDVSAAIEPGMRARIETLCSQDREIYEWARGLAAERST